MQLTSAVFEWLIILAACGSIAGTAWLWPRLSRQRVVTILARISLIILGQAIVVMATFVIVNDALVFFGSWSALLGGSAPQPIEEPSSPAAFAAAPQLITITGSTVGTTFRGGPALRLPDGHLAAGVRPTATGLAGRGAGADKYGAVLRVTIRGEYTGISSTGDYVYLPPQYFQYGYADDRFPVVLAFTGYPNEPLDLMQPLHLPAIANSLGAAGLIGPAIYVMVNPSVALPRDTECTNIPGGLQVATFFGTDVPLAVQQTFAAQSAASGWATIGYSTGGYCAAKVAMLYPSQFSAAVGLSAYYVALRDLTTGDLYGGSVAYRDENNLDWRLAHLPAPPIAVLVASSSGERTLPGAFAFMHLIRPPMRGYSLILRLGGHNYNTWRRQLPQSLEWLGARLTPASDQATGLGS